MNPYGQVAGVTTEEQGVDVNATNASTTSTETQAPADTGASASNFTVSQAFGFFNILVGLMLVAALLFFFGGFIAYLSRLGLENRVQGLRYMYYGITILFVLVILLAIVHYLQFHPAVVFGIVAVLIVIFGAWAIVQASQEKSADHEEE